MQRAVRRLEELVGDIKVKGGLIHRVIFCDGMLLDGRNRIEALERVGLLIESLKEKD